MSQQRKVQPFDRVWFEQMVQSEAGQRVLKMLTGQDKIEQKLKEIGERIEALHHKVVAMNDLLVSCLKFKEPVFTLELPDKVLLKLINYGSVGEVLFMFKLNSESRQELEIMLGEEGFSLLGSRLISKGYLVSNDPMFQNW